jgi:hypothetical protein
MRLSGGDCKANAVVDVRISLCVMYDSHPTSHAHGKSSKLHWFFIHNTKGTLMGKQTGVSEYCYIINYPQICSHRKHTRGLCLIKMRG